MDPIASLVSAVVKASIQAWLGNSALSAGLGSLADTAVKTGSKRLSEVEASKEQEATARKATELLATTLSAYGTHLDAPSRQQVASLAKKALHRSDLSPQLLIDHNLSPAWLKGHFASKIQEDCQFLDDDASKLLDAVLSNIAETVLSHAPHQEGFALALARKQLELGNEARSHNHGNGQPTQAEDLALLLKEAGPILRALTLAVPKIPFEGQRMSPAELALELRKLESEDERRRLHAASTRYRVNATVLTIVVGMVLLFINSLLEHFEMTALARVVLTMEFMTLTYFAVVLSTVGTWLTFAKGMLTVPVVSAWSTGKGVAAAGTLAAIGIPAGEFASLLVRQIDASSIFRSISASAVTEAEVVKAWEDWKLCNRFETTSHCREAGYFLARIEPLDRKRSHEASRLLTIACEASDPAACTILGKLSTDLGDNKRARKYLRRGCELGFKCDLLTEFAQKLHSATDREDDYTIACDGGSIVACYNLGVEYRISTEGKPDPLKRSLYKKAADAFTKGCKLDDGISCVHAAYHKNELGRDLFSASEVSSLIKTATEALEKDAREKNCVQKTTSWECIKCGEALADLGELHWKLEMTTRDEVDKEWHRPAAVSAFELSCSIGYSEGCAELSEAYRLGALGLERDPELAKEFDEKFKSYLSARCEAWPDDCRIVEKRGYSHP